MRRSSAQEIAEVLRGKRAAGGWVACCPCHDDTTPSLSISETEDGTVLLKCHAGCDQQLVAETVKGMVGADVLSGHRNEPIQRVAHTVATPAFRPVAGRYADPVDLKLGELGRVPDDMWVYHDEDGQVLHYVARYNMGEGKQIRPWVWDGERWVPKAYPDPRPLYRLNEIARSTDAKVMMFEGEKAADAGRKYFSPAVCTTWSGGANALERSDFSPLRGRTVILCPDNDTAGQRAMDLAAIRLQKLGCEIWMLRAPNGSALKWDIADADWSKEQAQEWLAGAKLVHRPPRATLSYTEFAAQLCQPEWVIDGVLQKGQVGALTARTNHGKTAVSLFMVLCVASGRRVGNYATAPGHVLILCGEDPDGFRTRLIAMAHEMRLTPDDLARVHVIPEPFPLASQVEDRIEAIVSQSHGVSYRMVLVDTSVAYFAGDKEDDNVQARDHAMALRKLKRIPGSPAVLANCHPVKNAERENLIPRGGSAFLNEIDFNLSLWSDGTSAEFHWHHKKRGPDFDPMHFEFHERVVEQGGMRLETVIALPISDERETAINRQQDEDENRMLWAMQHHSGGSLSDWANACGWVNKKGEPIKAKAQRVVGNLAKEKLVRKYRRRWVLTESGKSEASRIS